MKRYFFVLLALVLTTACTNEPEGFIHSKGIGPVKIGMSIAELPAQVEGLYDEIQKIDEEGYFDEFMGEEIPPRDKYLFKKMGEVIFMTECEDGETQIEYLEALSPMLSHRGVCPGMSCKEVLQTEAKLHAGGYPESCEFVCCWRFPEPSIEAWGEGTVLSNSGISYFTKMDENDLYNGQEPRTDFKAEYFTDEYRIQKIVIR